MARTSKKGAKSKRHSRYPVARLKPRKRGTFERVAQKAFRGMGERRVSRNPSPLRGAKLEHEESRYKTRAEAEKQVKMLRTSYRDVFKARVQPVPSRSRPRETSYAIIISPTKSYEPIWRDLKGLPKKNPRRVNRPSGAKTGLTEADAYDKAAMMAEAAYDNRYRFVVERSRNGTYRVERKRRVSRNPPPLHEKNPHRTVRNTYPPWTAGYSNEDFDRAQSYAQELTDADRRAGRPAPAHGYSAERIAQAQREVRDANLHSAASQHRRRVSRNPPPLYRAIGVDSSGRRHPIGSGQVAAMRETAMARWLGDPSMRSAYVLGRLGHSHLTLEPRDRARLQGNPSVSREMQKEWDRVNYAARLAEKSGDYRAAEAAKAEVNRVYREMQNVRLGITPNVGREDLGELPDDAVTITDGIAAVIDRALDWRVYEELRDGRWRLIDVKRTLREVRQRYAPDEDEP